MTLPNQGGDELLEYTRVALRGSSILFYWSFVGIAVWIATVVVWGILGGSSGVYLGDLAYLAVSVFVVVYGAHLLRRGIEGIGRYFNNHDLVSEAGSQFVWWIVTLIIPIIGLIFLGMSMRKISKTLYELTNIDNFDVAEDEWKWAEYLAIIVAGLIAVPFAMYNMRKGFKRMMALMMPQTTPQRGEEDRTRVVEKTRVIGEEQPPPPPPLPPPPPSQPQPRSSGGHGAGPWKILAIVFAILFAVMLVIAVGVYYVESSNAHYWQSQYYALESNYSILKGQYGNLYSNYVSLVNQLNNLQNQYNSLNNEYQMLQSQYSALQSRYSNIQSTYSSLQSKYTILRGLYNILLQQLGGSVVMDPQGFYTSHVYLGDNDAYSTNQWPMYYGSSIVSQYWNQLSINLPVLELTPAQADVSGVVLWPVYYNGGKITIAIIGTYSSGTSPPADGFVIYLFMQPSTWSISPSYNYSMTYATTENWAGTGAPSPMWNDVIFPPSSVTYLVVQWDPYWQIGYTTSGATGQWNVWLITYTTNVAYLSPSPSPNLGSYYPGWEGIGSGAFRPNPGDYILITITYDPTTNTLSGAAYDLNTNQEASFTLNLSGYYTPPNAGYYVFGVGASTSKYGTANWGVIYIAYWNS